MEAQKGPQEINQLKDPNNTRVVKELPLPPERPLDTAQIFRDNLVDWRLVRQHIKNEGRIAKDDFFTLIIKATAIFSTPSSTQSRNPTSCTSKTP
jgi:serine/threonine-protein phosphatase 2B catalytic subunit